MTTILPNALANVFNKYVSNRAQSWNRIYAREYAQKLNSADESARNYVIAGMVQDLAKTHSKILDVGCGVGTTYERLRPLSLDYHGIDLSSKAIEACEKTFRGQDSRRFTVGNFQDVIPEARYDVIIFNEVLYYFPLREIPNVLSKAAALLEASGVILISMSRNPKASWIWAICRSLGKPYRAIDVRASWSHNWKVKAYKPQNNTLYRLGDRLRGL